MVPLAEKFVMAIFIACSEYFEDLQINLSEKFNYAIESRTFTSIESKVALNTLS